MLICHAVLGIPPKACLTVITESARSTSPRACPEELKGTGSAETGPTITYPVRKLDLDSLLLFVNRLIVEKTISFVGA
jgi:hypothetical protein